MPSYLFARRLTIFLLLIGNINYLSAYADGPADNVAAKVRPIPPEGIEVPEATKTELLQAASSLRLKLQNIKSMDGVSLELIEVIPRAIELAVEQGMFYSDKEFAQAKELIVLAEARIAVATAGKTKFDLLSISKDASEKPQLTVGGYRSQLDGSVQPYGLVIPANWRSDQPLRLDVWLHGRAEKTSEVAFLYQRMHQVGEFAPPNTIVLHPYGRYCNAFKFAGEVDVLEAIENVKKLFNIDESRIAIRGFSMGGAGCWQMAVHYPQLFVAANPGAGFSETMEFLRIFQSENFKPTDYQKKLLHWYDCPDWTNNLRNVPTVAYSGEVDNQRQAAEVMVAAYKLRGMHLPHIIGPKTAHKILAESKPIIQKQLDEAIDAGKTRFPKSVDLTTYMLRYHEMAWLSIEGLDKHWEESTVHAELKAQSLLVQSRNVSKIKLEFKGEGIPFKVDQPMRAVIDSQPMILAASSEKDRWVQWLSKDNRGQWTASPVEPVSSLAKRPGLSGPIDDAFMEPFIWVAPTDVDSASPSWFVSEFKHATQEWRRHFRGDIISKQANAVTEADIADKNLILFGTPATNPLIAKMVAQLPIKWTDNSLSMAGGEYSASTHAPILIYPNPLNPKRYVVINSGFTFREFAYLNNARQIPMLPDWAVVDFSAGATTQSPGKVIAGGFFDEHWK